MPLPVLRINKVEFIASKGERYAWYLTIVKIDNQQCLFWSHHKCTGMSDRQAATLFESDHYEEVTELVKQRMKNQVVNN